MIVRLGGIAARYVAELLEDAAAEAAAAAAELYDDLAYAAPYDPDFSDYGHTSYCSDCGHVDACHCGVDYAAIAAAAIAAGGITIRPLTGEIPSAGYVVSVPFCERTDTAIDADRIAAYVRDHAHDLSYGAHFFGAWCDNGVWYYDISIVVDDLNTALQYARDWNQIALYDIANQTSVYV